MSERSVGFSTFRGLYLTLSLAFVAGILQAEDRFPVTEARPQPPQTNSFVRFAGDRLTLKVKDISLEELLQEIARQTGLILVLSAALKERATIEFYQVSLDDALHRILRHQNFAIEYAPQTASGRQSTVQRPSRLWIFAKGVKSYPVHDASGKSASRDIATDIQKLQAALASDDSGDRGAAVEALGDSDRPEAIAPLRLALRDQDDQVREAAVAALVNIGSDEAAQALAIALRDREAWLREVAVTALGEIGGESAIRLLRRALADEDESVREAAAEALAQLSH